eukprot:GHVO01034280.1.p1 GENE.GHVO01034280.1~~GHVO01034280.1.p1  ORF type:complete len:262 (+),score=55.44 GHVO01034280.1:30-788(+)
MNTATDALFDDDNISEDERTPPQSPHESPILSPPIDSPVAPPVDPIPIGDVIEAEEPIAIQDGQKFVAIKLPAAVRVDFDGAPDGKVQSDTSVMRYENGESNSKLVEWNDGSYTLFIGDVAYDAQIQPEKSSAYDSLKPESLCMDINLSDSTERWVFRVASAAAVSRSSGLLRSTSAAQDSQSRRSKLTTVEDALQADIAMKLQQEASEELQRKQQELKRKRTGLSASYLEDDDDSDDDRDISKIKERYRKR